jgi:RNA polymerase sigma-70 factor (ECF subfamily)
LPPHLTRHAFDGAYISRLVGEDTATERHFTQYFEELLSLKLRSRLQSRTLIEEAKQETFVRVLTALKQRGGIDHPEALGAFVNSVCNNVLFELYRSENRTQPLAEIAADPPDEKAADLESALLRKQERERLRRALEGLPRKDQELLRWLFLEERDKDDVCRQLRIERGYLRVLLFRAKGRLRAELEALKERAGS